MDGTFVEAVGRLKTPFQFKANGLPYVAFPEVDAQGQERWRLQGGLIGYELNGIGAHAPKPEPLRFEILKGLLSYVRENPDKVGKMFLVVENPRSILCVGENDSGGLRPTWAEVSNGRGGKESVVMHGNPMDPEAFLALLRKEFRDTTDRGYLLELVSTLRMEAVTTLTDDGVTQRAAVKDGVHFAKSVPIRPELELAPADLTFPDVEPPLMKHVFRLLGGGEKEKPKCVLLSCRVPEWDAAVCQKLATILGEATKDLPHVTVIG